MIYELKKGGEYMKIFVFAVTTVVLSVIMAASTLVFGQTATPTTVTSPTTATSPTATRTPTPTGMTQSGTVPSGAPATGMGGN